MQIVKTSVCVRISKKNPDENTFVMIEKKYLDYIQIMRFINFLFKNQPDFYSFKQYIPMYLASDS